MKVVFFTENIDRIDEIRKEFSDFPDFIQIKVCDCLSSLFNSLSEIEVPNIICADRRFSNQIMQFIAPNISKFWGADIIFFGESSNEWEIEFGVDLFRRVRNSIYDYVECK